MARVSIEEALDDCLQRLPHEGLDACLRRYPGYADELRGLLQVGTMVSRTSAATVLSDEARQRMRAQLFKPAPATTANSAVSDNGAQPTRVLPLPATSPRLAGRGVLLSHPLARAALVLLVLAALFLGGGVAAAHTAPGDALYPVKRLYEGVRYTFSLSDSDKANARLDFASARLDEMEALYQSKGTIDADLLTDLAGNVSYCSDELNSNSFSAKQQLARAFGAFLQREQQVLGAVSSDVNTNAQHLYTTAKQSIAQYYETVTRYAPSVPPLATPKASPSATPNLPAAQDTPSVLPNVATPSDTVVLTGTAAVPTNIPTNTPTVLPTNTVQPSLTNAAQPSPTKAGPHNGPTNTPLPSTPRPKPSDTPLPPHSSPTPTYLPAPTATSTPIKLKLTPTPKPTIPLPTAVVPPPTPNPTITSGSTKGGKGKGKGDGQGGNGQGGDGQGNGGGNGQGNGHGNGNGGDGG